MKNFGNNKTTGKAFKNRPSSVKGAQIKLEGDWGNMARMMNTMPLDIRTSYIKAQTTMAKRLQKIIKEHIMDNDMGWKALNKRTISIKGHGNPWYDTGAIYNNISIITKGMKVFVGIPKGSSSYDGKRSLQSIAGAMEYGTGKMTARPLFLPSSREIDQRYMQRVFGQHLTFKLRRKYGIKPKYR
jgi:hypothetical protein